MGLPTYNAAAKICNKKGIAASSDIELMARQLGMDIVNRGMRLVQLGSSLYQDEADRLRNIVLIEEETAKIGNMVTAIRVVICDAKG